MTFGDLLNKLIALGVGIAFWSYVEVTQTSEAVFENPDELGYFKGPPIKVPDTFPEEWCHA